MGKKLLSITVKGKQHEWGFNFYADPKHIPTWIEDGLDVVQIENIVPEWIVDIGMLKPYVFIQDLFNFKNPFKSKEKTTSIIESESDDYDQQN